MAKQGRRGQNEGSIYKRSDGRWTGVVNLGYQNGRLRRKYYYGRTRSEVQGKLIAAQHDLQQGLPVLSERMTLKQFLEQWLESSVRQSVRPATFVSYAQQVRIHISPALGHLLLSKLTPLHIQNYLNERLESGNKRPSGKGTESEKRGLSPTTARYHLILLKKALTQALRWGLVSRNVAQSVSPPKLKKFVVQPITEQQAQSFFEAIRGDRLEAFFTLSLGLGLRKGEILGLQWSSVDLKAGTLRVSKCLQRLGGEYVLLEPKSESSRRSFELPEPILVKIREHRARQLEERMRAGENWQESDLVFSSKFGGPINPRSINRRLDVLLTKAGLPHCRQHDLRHYFASLLLSQGVSLKVISELLGHSSIIITANLYTHVLPSVKKEALDVVGSMLSSKK